MDYSFSSTNIISVEKFSLDYSRTTFHLIFPFLAELRAHHNIINPGWSNPVLISILSFLQQILIFKEPTICSTLLVSVHRTGVYT